MEEGRWAAYVRTHREQFRYGLPLLVLALLAMLVTDEAKWAQAVAGISLLTFIGLGLWGHERAYREVLAQHPMSRTQQIVYGIAGAVIGVGVVLLIGFLGSWLT